LIKLNFLSLGQNLLTGNIPNELGQLTNLNWLALEYELFDWRCSH
jgi:hypothetical protein